MIESYGTVIIFLRHQLHGQNEGWKKNKQKQSRPGWLNLTRWTRIYAYLVHLTNNYRKNNITLRLVLGTHRSLFMLSNCSTPQIIVYKMWFGSFLVWLIVNTDDVMAIAGNSAFYVKHKLPVKMIVEKPVKTGCNVNPKTKCQFWQVLTC